MGSIIAVILILWSIAILYTVFCIVVARVRKKPDSDTVLINKVMTSYATGVFCGIFGFMFLVQVVVKLVTLFGK